MSKKNTIKRINPSTQFSLTTSYSYWKEIRNLLEASVGLLQKELEVIDRHLPESTSYYTMSSIASDARSVFKVVNDFVESIIEEELKGLYDD